MYVRSYQSEDQDEVIALWQACGLLRPWNDPLVDILRKQSVGADLFLVGTLDNAIVGAVMGGYDGHRGWMNYLAVAPDRQGQGFGRTIVQALEARLKAIGCPKLNLQVRSDNTKVINYYKQCGYSVDDVISFGKRLIPDEPSAISKNES